MDLILFYGMVQSFGIILDPKVIVTFLKFCPGLALMALYGLMLYAGHKTKVPHQIKRLHRGTFFPPLLNGL